jgi:hypothetical protein
MLRKLFLLGVLWVGVFSSLANATTFEAKLPIRTKFRSPLRQPGE